MQVYRHQLRRLARNLSTAVDGCPNREFAKIYPAAASQVLTVPPYSYDQVIANPWSRDGSLEQYLEWRGWDINSTLSDHNLTDDRISEAAIGLLSHPLTFPLTLARHLTELTGKKDAARLCCVGARAECTLPDKYWRELLIAALTTRIEPDIGIDFVGPDVPPQLKSKTITLDKDENTTTQLPPERKLTMTFHPSYLHEVVLKILKSQPDSSPEQIKNAWDGFVLYNPGLGHPNLAPKWQHTLKFMIGTGKPILFTAHSTIDAKRDQLVLEKLLADCDDDRIVQYESNVFASRMEFIDPFSKDHVLSPNHSVFLLE